MITTMLRWAGTARTLSLGTLVLTTLISYGFLGFAVLQGWPLWLMTLAALTPWTPVFALATRWTATRADLHFLYNLAETVPLLIAFGIELRHGLRMRASGGRGAALMPARPRAWR